MFCLQGLMVQQNAVVEWGSMCDELTEEDLETETEAEMGLACCLLLKQPDLPTAETAGRVGRALRPARGPASRIHPV
jgi:hypothetical protein